MNKRYYLGQGRALFSGIVFIIIGLLPFILFANLIRNFSDVLKFFFGFPEILIFLIFCVFLYLGIRMLLNSKTAIRAKLDNNGFHFLRIKPEEGRYVMMFELVSIKNNLTYIPYSEIKNIKLSKSSLFGDFVELETMDQKKEILVGIGGLKRCEKEDIVSTIKSKIIK